MGRGGGKEVWSGKTVDTFFFYKHSVFKCAFFYTLILFTNLVADFTIIVHYLDYSDSTSTIVEL